MSGASPRFKAIVSSALVLFSFALFPLVVTAQQAVSASVPLPTALKQLAKSEGLRFGFAIDPSDVPTVPSAQASSWKLLAEHLRQAGIAVDTTGDGQILIATSFAATNQAIEVRVTHGGRAMPLATLHTQSGRTFFTDERATAKVYIADSSDTVSCRYLGYQTVQVSPQQLRRTGGLIELLRDTFTLTAVDFVALRPVSPKVIEVPGVAAAALSDLALRLNQGSLPVLLASGVAGWGTGDEGLALRGTPSSETLITLNRAPSYTSSSRNPYLSPFATRQAQQLTIHKGAYPTWQGGYRGGMIEVERGKPEQAQLSATISPLTLEADGQLATKSHALSASYRGTLGEIGARKLLGGASEESPALMLPHVEQHDLHLAGHSELMQGKVQLNAEAMRTSATQRYSFKELVDADDGTHTQLLYGLGASSRAELLRLGADVQLRRANLKLTAYHSGLRDTSETNTFGRKLENLAPTIQLQSISRTRLIDEGVILSLHAADTSRLDWSAGIHVQQLTALTDAVLAGAQPIGLDEQQVLVHAFGRHRIRLGVGHDLSLGLRLTHVTVTNLNFASPRIWWRYPLGQRVTLHANYAYTRQAVTTVQLDDLTGQRTQLLTFAPPDLYVPPHAHSLAAAIERRSSASWWRVEPYAVYTTGRLASVNTSLGMQSTTVFGGVSFGAFDILNGYGRAAGLELEGGLSLGDWQAQGAYTLSTQQQRFAELANNVWHRGPLDQPHRLVGAIEWLRDGWTIGATTAWASGLLYVDPGIVASAETSRLSLPPADYQRRLPNYLRHDVSISYRHRWNSLGIELGLRVNDVLDRQNVIGRPFAFDPTSAQQTPRYASQDLSVLGRMILGSVRVEIGPH